MMTLHSGIPSYLTVCVVNAGKMWLIVEHDTCIKSCLAEYLLCSHQTRLLTRRFHRVKSSILSVIHLGNFQVPVVRL